jgi:hypothetical protein
MLEYLAKVTAIYPGRSIYEDRRDQNVLVESFTKVGATPGRRNQLVEEAYVGDQAEGNSALLASCSPPCAGRTPASACAASRA